MAARRGASARSIWLISFTDLMCLMLAFFVLAFSMSEPDQGNWRAMAQSLAPALASGRVGARTGALFNVEMLDPRTPINLDYLGSLLLGQFARDADLAGVVPMRQDDRVIIGLPDVLLFEQDGANFSERGRRVLFVLGGVLGRISNRVEIIGHAEREQPALESARDTRELALSRAVAVGTALRQAGYARGLVVRAVGQPLGTSVLAGRARLIDVVVRDLEEGS
ncbi:MAG: flagellar motor protein MotB [Rhodospirillaceae bacterium]